MKNFKVHKIENVGDFRKFAYHSEIKKIDRRTESISFKQSLEPNCNEPLNSFE